MAEAWSQMPEDVEQRVSALWADRFVVQRNEQARAAKPKRIAGEGGKKLI